MNNNGVVAAGFQPADSAVGGEDEGTPPPLQERSVDLRLSSPFRGQISHLPTLGGWGAH